MTKSGWNLKSIFAIVFSLLLFVQPFAFARREGAPPKWAYDPGPNPETQMGKELIDINARIPFMPGISKEILGNQKFRPAFGPIPWRMQQKPNSVKILFIGQDGTHIAEAAGRPATASFGGRAQDLANYFGVDESAAFMNAYSFTIKGQYGSFSSPVLVNENGQKKFRFTSYVDNKLWLMTQDLDSPITQWRNDLIDWIIRNNKDSIQLIVLFGGAARDAAGAFLSSRGAKVYSKTSPLFLKNMQVPETAIVPAGSNNEFAVPLTIDGKDLYAELLGRELDYASENGADQTKAMNSLTANLDEAVNMMVFSRGGLYSSGVLNAAQLGGYDLLKMEVNGVKSLSLKGLQLSDGTRLSKDVLVVQLPHPSSLSKMSKEAASSQVAKALENFKPYVQNGWEIQADPGMTNQFAEKKSYEYARADIGSEYYDFGAPASRMVSVSDASRLSGNPHVIVFGTRDKAKFDMNAIAAMTKAKPSQVPNANEMYTTRARLAETRYIFDAGPGEKYARIMKENLNLEVISEAKPGMSWEKNGIVAYNIKSHPDTIDFGHYRGTFKNPRVLILADPSGFDDLITARALTGARGQYLHGLMSDLGIGENYLLLKTVPFGMDGASDSEWESVLKATTEYRKQLIEAVLADGKPELIVSDGKYAASELQKILGNQFEQLNIPVVNIQRGMEANSGILEAGKRFIGIQDFSGKKVSGKMMDIPRSHLSFYARLWEGTSGDRVINSSDKYKGKAFAVVAPEWAWKQSVAPSKAESEGIAKLKRKLEENNLPKAGESIPDFVKRKRRGAWILDKNLDPLAFVYRNAA